jgi:hypothetical protein
MGMDDEVESPFMQQPSDRKQSNDNKVATTNGLQGSRDQN